MPATTYPPFKPAWWLKNPHLQTLWPLVFKQALPGMQEIKVELPDGDFVETSHLPHESAQHAIVFHGLEGSVNSHYVRRILNTLNDHKITFTFVHFRGCGKQPNRKDYSYHSGHTDDIDFIIRQIKHQHPGKQIIAIGYSLGGNALLKYLGEPVCQVSAAKTIPRSKLLHKAIAVSPPMQLDACATRLDQGFSRIYLHHLLSSLKRKTMNKFGNAPLPPVDLEAVKKCASFWEFDDLVTARLNGFKNVDHYYTKSSAKQYLNKISTPTLILQAKDDPFLSPEAFPEENDLSHYIKYELFSHGGHVGFVSGNVPGIADYWLEQRMLAYIRD